jgi:uncharacterized BrkB/YihY/UPF0761 family membrane protein
MSTASPVRETRDLTGDDAWRTLTTTGWLKLVRDAVMRLRAADGFSHSRSLAFAMSLVFMQGVIALVGVAIAFGQNNFSGTILAAIESAAPGPANDFLEYAFAQARHVALEHRSFPLLVGLVGTLVTASTATGQLMRGINRLYGVEYDGPFVRKYARAVLLAVVVLATLATTGVILTLRRDLQIHSGGGARLIWYVLRWPIALALAAAAFGGILRWAPRRRQPRWSWLVFGGAIGTTGCVLVTLGLSLFLRLSSSFGDVYGPLAGIVALQLWMFFSAVAAFFGAAVTAQLEAVRWGSQSPRRD